MSIFVGRVCVNCVMDESDPLISFDEKGVCNHCKEYTGTAEKKLLPPTQRDAELKNIISLIKSEGKGKKYDCILGISGGTDSSYMAYLAKKNGLRPLIVHFDNGWNSELAVKNIENILSKLEFDLETFVIDWEEFKDIQLAYLKAGVIDIEAITDHAIAGTLYKLAGKHNIKYILSGYNVVTEAILPNAWVHNKQDHINIIDIHNKFGTIPLKNFPFFDSMSKKKYINAKGIKTINILNYIDYNKKKVQQILKDELDWRDYGGKHYESIFTRFYQGYILPTKFNVDKRKAHLSTLICSGQITKEDALEELEKPIYDIEQLKTDKEFVLKKLGLSEEEFEGIMKKEPVPHSNFKVGTGSIYDEYKWLKPFKPILSSIKRK